MICDTCGLLAAFDATDIAHNSAMRGLQAAAELVVSPLVVAELDYLLRHRVSAHAAQLAIAELAGGAYDVPAFGPPDLRRALEIDRQFPDLGFGITDASLVVLVARYDTGELLTLDHRHFRQLTPLQGGRFRLLPIWREEMPQQRKDVLQIASDDSWGARALLPAGPAAVRQGNEILSRFELIRVNNRILSTAGTLCPAELRSLDAIHLATAQLLGDDLAQLVTYDTRMAEAARSLGWMVAAPA